MRVLRKIRAPCARFASIAEFLTPRADESLDESGNSRNLRAAEALTSDRVPHHACGETVRAPKSETAFTLPGNHIMAKSC